MNVHAKPPLSNLQARDLDSVIHPYSRRCTACAKWDRSS